MKKLLASYLKELKIASRGFWFYVELIVAVIVLMVLMMVIKPYPDGKNDEYLYFEVPEQVREYMIRRDLDAGRIELGEPKEIKLKEADLIVCDQDDPALSEHIVHEAKERITVDTICKINRSTGARKGTTYIMPDRESMLIAAWQSGKIGAAITMDGDGTMHYEYINQGYETERYRDVLYLLHTYDVETVEKVKEGHAVREIGRTGRLNAREAFVPVYLTFACALMGFFIVCAYVFLDKGEDVIKAFLVTPGSIMTYLISKMMLVMTTGIISSLIVMVPVMGAGPDYLLAALMLIAASCCFSSLGLLVASFWDSMQKAFGVLYIIMLGLMIPPLLSYYIGSFDPMWIHFIPTWSLLTSMKMIMEGAPEAGFIAVTGIGMAALGTVLLLMSAWRFRKTMGA